MAIDYIEVTCQKALNPIRRKTLPYDWDLNIYRGCGHQCVYCFALYSHRYMGSEDFFKNIYGKSNIVEALEKQVTSKSWKPGVINLGGVTDSYQPIEAKVKRMPEIIRILIEHRIPTVISTKSDLILRDFELWKKLASVTYLNVAVTVTTPIESIRECIEPGGVSTQRRLDVLSAFRETEANRGAHVMPILPYITDTYDNIDALFKEIKRVEPTYVLTGTLNLRGPTKDCYFNFLSNCFPSYVEPTKKLYKSGKLDVEYRKQLSIFLSGLKKKYGLSSNYLKNLKDQLKKHEDSKQYELFK